MTTLENKVEAKIQGLYTKEEVLLVENKQEGGDVSLKLDEVQLKRNIPKDMYEDIMDRILTYIDIQRAMEEVEKGEFLDVNEVLNNMKSKLSL